MPIDKASIFAERYKANPNVLRAAVLGQQVSPELDAYTALRALQLVNEANRYQQSLGAQGPTGSPSLVSEAVGPQAPMGLGALTAGAPGTGPAAQAAGCAGPYADARPEQPGDARLRLWRRQ